jgi:TPP-dependent pyruvate/acetoin dehydrogenase alpha subunit
VLTPPELISFEKEIAEAFERGEIRGPVHLSGGNEDQLIKVFKDVQKEDWIFSTWRNHYHALLHGIPADKVKAEILAGRSMNLSFPEHRFYSSAIVGGILPIAVGVAAAIKRQGSPRKVWCFVGDMAATTGIFHEANTYAFRQDLPIEFVIEDNGLSTNTPTEETWGIPGFFKPPKHVRYAYTRTYPHCGIGKWVQF